MPVGDGIQQRVRMERPLVEAVKIVTHKRVGGMMKKGQRQVQTLLAILVAALGYAVPNMNDLRRRDLAVPIPTG
jgi:hypothetical protein